MKCVTCCKDFGENHTNYDRHMGSKEHLGRLFNKKSSVAVAERREDGVVGAPPTPNTGIPSVLPPPSLMMAPVRTQVFTTPSIPDTLPPVNWKKWAMIGGAILLVLYILNSMEKGNRLPAPAAGAASVPGRSLPGNLANMIPPALIGIVGLLMLSKLMRGEFTGWNKIFKDWAK